MNNELVISRFVGTPALLTGEAAGVDSGLSPSYLTCYQCGHQVSYLFDDCRCGECTRLTIEDVRGH